MANSLFSRRRPLYYVQIWETRLKIVDVFAGTLFDEVPDVAISTDAKGQRTVVAIGAAAKAGPGVTLANPFSHPRTVLNDFFLAQALLRRSFALVKGARFAPAPRVVVQAMEKNQGGLSAIEVRAFEELLLGLGAKAVAVHQGQALSMGELAAGPFWQGAKASSAKQGWLTLAIVLGALALAFIK